MAVSYALFGPGLLFRSWARHGGLLHDFAGEELAVVHEGLPLCHPARIPAAGHCTLPHCYHNNMFGNLSVVDESSTTTLVSSSRSPNLSAGKRCEHRPGKSENSIGIQVMIPCPLALQLEVVCPCLLFPRVFKETGTVLLVVEFRIRIVVVAIDYCRHHGYRYRCCNYRCCCHRRW